MPDRPDLSPGLTEEELGRWYWTMAELQPFARSLGVSAAGPKTALIERIGAHLAGRPLPTQPRRRARSTAQLTEPLDTTTVIPTGQRSTAVLRRFFEREIGPQFRFDGHMRSFLANSDGATLGDAIEHWHATRGQELPTQSASLEFNAFTKAWHRIHPEGSGKECRAAWNRHRNLPVDQRPALGDA